MKTEPFCHSVQNPSLSRSLRKFVVNKNSSKKHFLSFQLSIFFSYIDNFNVTPLSTILSLNVICSTQNNCTQYLSFGCSNGIELKCSQRPLRSFFLIDNYHLFILALKCPKGMYLFGENKCISIPNITVESYEAGKSYCSEKNLTLVSLSLQNTTTQINSVLKVLKRIKLS